MAMAHRRSSLPLAGLLLVLAGCSSSSSVAPAQAYAKNGFDPSALSVGVFKVSYRGTTIAGPLADGEESAPVVVGHGTDYAYALVAYGWKSGDPAPAQLALVRSRLPIVATDDRAVPLVFSFADALGRCGEPALGADDYAAAAKSYFPGDAVQDFAAVTCPQLATADAGADASDASGASDAGADTATPSDAAADTGSAADAADAGADSATAADASDAG